MSRIRRHTAHFFDMPPMWRLWLVGRQVLTKTVSPEERIAVVRDVFTRLSSLSGRWALLCIAGYRAEKEENVLLPKADLDAMAEELREQVISSSAAQLAHERDGAMLIGWAIPDGEHPGAAELLSDDEFLLSLLHGDLRQGHWFADGEIAQNLTQTLPGWDNFSRIFGAEWWAVRVREVVERASKEPLNEETRQLLELAGRYLTGWRPEADELRQDT